MNVMRRRTLGVLLAVAGSAAPALTQSPDSGRARYDEDAGLGSRADTIYVDSMPLGAARTLSELLSSRLPGVVVQQASGSSGTGARVRLRGSNSLLLSNDALVVLDGIRITSDLQGSTVNVGGQSPFRLDELNLEDIDHVVVRRGPATSWEYGTGAANGVIEITTKRGRRGGPRWHAFAEAGQLRDITDYPSNFLQVGRLTQSGARIAGCNIDLQARSICAPVADSLLSFSPLEQASPYRDGVRQSYGLSASGGGRVIDYFVSADFENEDGVYEANAARASGVRTSLGARPRDDLAVRLVAGYRDNRVRLPMNDNNVLGILANGMLGLASDDDLRGYLFGTPQQLFRIDTEHDARDVMGSLSAAWQPLAWLRLESTFGVDDLHRDQTQLLPANVIDLEGFDIDQVTTGSVRYSTHTAGLSAHVRLPLGARFRSLTMAGLEHARHDFRLDEAVALDGEEVFAASERIRGDFSAAYVRESIVWRERVILSGGLRGDDSEIFGRDAPRVWYPTASVVWRLRQESFFPDWRAIDDLRVSLAYGEAGQVSSIRSATTQQLAGASLRAEESREVELGIDAALLRGRVAVDLSLYDKRTLNAISTVRAATGGGGFTVRLGNTAEVTNRGVEALVTATVIDRPVARWSFGMSAARNENEVSDFNGAVQPLVFGFGDNSQRIQQGYPVGGYWARPIVSVTDHNGDGLISRVNCPTVAGVANPQVPGGPQCEIVIGEEEAFLGSPYPETEVALSSTLTLFGWLRLHALLDHRGGMKQYNVSEELRCVLATNCRGAQDATAPPDQQARALARLMGTRAGYIESASFWKLREVAVTLSAPAPLTRRLGVSDVSLTLAGRNLATWTDYTGSDPEVNMGGQLNFTHADVFGQSPVRTLLVRLSVVR
jgi:hypothetical protein